MPNKTLTPKQQYMIDQVAATMAIENMPLTPQAYENIRMIATGEKTADQIIEEIKKEYTSVR
jgi:hypothetical protein